MADKDIRKKAEAAKDKAFDVSKAGPALDVARKNAGQKFYQGDRPEVLEAAETMRPRMVSDTEKTAGRAEMIANREEKRAAEKEKAKEAAKKAADLAKAMGESEAKSKNNRHRNYTKPVK